MRQNPVRWRHGRVVLLADPCTDARLRPELEGGLDEIRVHTRSSIQRDQRLHTLKTLEPAIADQAPDDGAVLLLDPGLIILPIGACASNFQPLLAAPSDH